MPLNTASSSHSWSLLPDDRRRTAPSAAIQASTSHCDCSSRDQTERPHIGQQPETGKRRISCHQEYNTNLSPQM